MSDVNNQQVGGTHYKTAYEHWDYVLDTGQGYLEGQATKYVSRARKKNGLQDYQKALHFVDKMLSVWHLISSRDNRNYRSVNCAYTERFIEVNKLTEGEASVCHIIALWQTKDDLLSARHHVITLMETADSPKPVPLEDSNKHAERGEVDKTEDDFARHNEIAKSEKRT